MTMKNTIVYSDKDFTLAMEEGVPYLTADGRRFQLTCHPYEPCLYITDENGRKTAVHNSFEPTDTLEAFLASRTVRSITGREYDAKAFCRMVLYAAGKGDIGIDDAEKGFGEKPVENAEKAFGDSTVGKAAKDAPVITDDPFCELIRRYPDLVPEYYLIKNTGLGSGQNAHRKALERACRCLMAGDQESEGWNYDLDAATAHPLSVRELFSEELRPARYTYRQAFKDPAYGGEYTDADFAKVNDVLFPRGTEQLEVYAWSTDWSDYFEDVPEALCLSIYDRSLDRFIVIIAAATD